MTTRLRRAALAIVLLVVASSSSVRDPVAHADPPPVCGSRELDALVLRVLSAAHRCRPRDAPCEAIVRGCASTGRLGPYQLVGRQDGTSFVSLPQECTEPADCLSRERWPVGVRRRFGVGVTPCEAWCSWGGHVDVRRTSGGFAVGRVQVLYHD